MYLAPDLASTGVQVLNSRMPGSTKQLITTQTCRVYKFYSTSVQSVTSALSVFQRFLNCQTKRILIGRFTLLLSVIAQGFDVPLVGMVSRAVCQDVSMFSHLLDDTL